MISSKYDALGIIYTIGNSLTINTMVIVRTVKLRNSWYYKKSSNALRIETYSNEFLVQ